MRHAKYDGEVYPGAMLAPLQQLDQLQEPLLITMEDLGRVIRSGKTTCFKLVGSGEIESVLVGRKRMPVFESVKAYVQRLREQAKPVLRAA